MILYLLFSILYLMGNNNRTFHNKTLYKYNCELTEKKIIKSNKCFQIIIIKIINNYKEWDVKYD